MRFMRGKRLRLMTCDMIPRARRRTVSGIATPPTTSRLVRSNQARALLTTKSWCIEDMKSALTEVGDHRRHEVDMEKAERLALANRRLLAAARALDAFTSLKAVFQTKIAHAQRNPEARRLMFDDLDFLLRVEHRIDDQHERKALIGQMAELC